MKATGHVCLSIDDGPLICKRYTADTDKIVIEVNLGGEVVPSACPIVRARLEEMYEKFMERQPQRRQTDPLSR